MTAPADISLHRAARYIDEDLEYYFTDRRDKHNQIRPRDDIAPHVPEARPDARAPSRAQPGSLFHPYPRHALHRIFIGISFPLYSNSWGAAFLRYLLELLRPGGAIILPVYPELQAHEKGLWCRSSLESVFRSRRRLVGMSNIWAENDGVMSLRVGRKWPPVIASTARALWQQAPRAAWRCALQADAGAAAEAWRAACARHWRCAQMSAVGEQILRDRFGARRRLRIAAHGADAGLLMLELLFSPYLRVRRARAHGALEDRAELEALRQACAAGPHGALERETGDAHPHDAIFLLGPGAAADNGLTALARDGIVVRAPGVAAAPAGGLAQCAHYSTRVATRLRAQPPIHHYSVQIEQEIAAEARDPAGAYAVLQRA